MTYFARLVLGLLSHSFVPCFALIGLVISLQGLGVVLTFLGPFPFLVLLGLSTVVALLDHRFDLFFVTPLSCACISTPLSLHL